MAFDTCSISGYAVGWLVTDKKTRLAVHRPSFHELRDHPGRGLAPVAGPAIFRTDGLWVKGTVAKVVEMRRRRRELDGELRVQRPYVLFRIEATGDPGLIG